MKIKLNQTKSNHSTESNQCQSSVKFICLKLEKILAGISKHAPASWGHIEVVQIISAGEKWD